MRPSDHVKESFNNAVHIRNQIITVRCFNIYDAHIIYDTAGCTLKKDRRKPIVGELEIQVRKARHSIGIVHINLDFVLTSLKISNGLSAIFQPFPHLSRSTTLWSQSYAAHITGKQFSLHEIIQP